MQGTTMEIIFSDPDGFYRHARDADVAVLLFTRNEVECARVGNAVERLMLLSDDADQVQRFAGRMALMFEGYDADPRSLVEIPACVQFFRALDQQWSYWLHFLIPRPDVLNLALLMLVDVEPRMLDVDRRAFEIKDAMQLQKTLERLFASMNVLHRNFGISETVNRAITDAVTASLSDMLHR